jgi:hypothetical protein
MALVGNIRKYKRITPGQLGDPPGAFVASIVAAPIAARVASNQPDAQVQI